VGLAHAAVGLGVLWSSLWLGVRTPSPTRRAILLAVALVAPLAAATPFARHLGDPALLRIAPPPLSAEPPGVRVARLGMDGFVYDTGTGADLNELSNAYGRRAALPAYNVAARVGTLEDYSGFLSPRREQLTDHLRRAFPSLVRRYAVTHAAVVGRRLSPALAAGVAPALVGARPVFQEAPLELEYWELPHRPWATFARGAIAVESAVAARSALVPLLQSEDLGTVIVEAPAPPPCAPGRVLGVERRPERVAIEAEADGPALLVVNDAFWPGWTAAIDGAPASILAADVVVRAIPFPAGRHRLELRYEPPEVRIGWWLTAIGALALAASVAFPLRRSPICGR
jgi:hypothetical protein